MRVRLTITYDGTNYSGWQVQNNAVTIQQKLQEAVTAVTGERVKVTGSGRTDAGVHALGQVAHFDTESGVPICKFTQALNAHLPSDIRVISSQEESENFNACTSAKRKTYSYSLYVSEVELPLFERYKVRVHALPDLALMERVAKIFVGEHDFKCFNASGGGAKTTVRTVYDIKIKKEGQLLTFLVTGNGFLYNMVRTLVGTLLDVGYKKADEEKIKTMLSTGDRALCGKTLPAKGLTLLKVEY